MSICINSLHAEVGLEEQICTERTTYEDRNAVNAEKERCPFAVMISIENVMITALLVERSLN